MSRNLYSYSSYITPYYILYLINSAYLHFLFSYFSFTVSFLFLPKALSKYCFSIYLIHHPTFSSIFLPYSWLFFKTILLIFGTPLNNALCSLFFSRKICILTLPHLSIFISFLHVLVPHLHKSSYSLLSTLPSLSILKYGILY